MLEIIEYLPTGKCVCRCHCGTKKKFWTSNVKSGKSKSCGCLQRRKVPIEIARTFSLMRYRCNTATSPDYPRWGGVGIELRYQTVEQFYEDVGDKPTPQHSIDRIDNKGHYEPGNCRWATAKEQMNNRKRNHIITYKGRTQTLKQWCDELGLRYGTVSERIRRSWSYTDAFEKPVKHKFGVHKCQNTQ